MSWKVGLFVVASALVIACAEEPKVGQNHAPSDTHNPSSCNGVQKVAVSLVEFSVTPTPSSVKAGKIEFDVTNDSPETIHEFLVVKTDLSIPELPTNPDGSFNEECPNAPVLDEIEDIDPGVTATLTLDLVAGHYVLLCNMVEIEPDGEIESHFAEGMHVDFNVL